VLNLGKFHRPRAFFVVIRHVIDPNADWIKRINRASKGFNRSDAESMSFIPGSSHASYPSGSRITGIAVAHRRCHGIGGRGQNGASLYDLAAGVLPLIP
jgi:hypothetical protein